MNDPHNVALGVTLPQFGSDADRLIDAAQRAERAGLDSIWVFDHLWPLSGSKERPIFECWTTLSFVASATERIRIGTLVTRSSLRHPVLLAKMIATVAEIAPGRLIVAIGSGDEASRDENLAFGLPYWSADRRIGQYKATFETVRRFLSDDSVDYSDEFVRISGLVPSPRPESLPLLWGAGHSTDVIEVSARLADGWNGWGGTPDRFAQDAQELLRLAEGRVFELSWAGQIALGKDEGDARARLGKRNPRNWTVGDSEAVTGHLLGFARAGASHLIASLPDAGTPGAYELLADEVGPRLAAAGYLRA